MKSKMLSRAAGISLILFALISLSAQGIIHAVASRQSWTLLNLGLVTTPVSWAQGGGKAEPLRITFKPGTTSTTVSGKVRGSEEAEYVLAAKKGQKLTIKLTSAPSRSSVFDIKAPDNADLGLEFDANYDFNKVLPSTGDYFITVVRPTTAKGTSNYKLLIQIR